MSTLTASRPQVQSPTKSYVPVALLPKSALPNKPGHMAFFIGCCDDRNQECLYKILPGIQLYDEFGVLTEWSVIFKKLADNVQYEVHFDDVEGTASCTCPAGKKKNLKKKWCKHIRLVRSATQLISPAY